MKREVWSIFSAIVWIGGTHAYEATLKFTDCSGIHYVHENKRFRMEWDGDAITKWSQCKVTLHGYDKSNVLDEYKTCIKATKWVIDNADVTLKYFSAQTVLQDRLQKEFSATTYDSPKTEWCSESEDYVDVELFTNPSKSNQGEIVLEIYADKTFDYSKTVGAIVGGVIGGIAVIAVIVTIVAICMCRGRSRASTGRVLSNPNTGAIVQQGPQPIQGYGTPYNAAAPPPSYYNATNVPQNTTPIKSGDNSTSYQPVPTAPPQ